MGRQSCGGERQEHPFHVKKAADESRRGKEPGVRRGREPRGLAAFFALAGSVSCGDAFKLNFEV